MRRVLTIAGLLALAALLLVVVLSRGADDSEARRPASTTTPTITEQADDESPSAERTRRRVVQTEPTPPPASEPASDPDGATGPEQQVVVHVVDERGEPICGALVARARPATFQTTLVGGPPIIDFPRTSDAAGDTHFRPSEDDGFYGTHGALTGWAQQESDGETRKNTVRLVMRPGVYVRGRVERPDGRPAPDASVRLAISADAARVFRGVAVPTGRGTTTDAEGRFEVGPFPPPPWPEPMEIRAQLGADHCTENVYDERMLVLRLIETQFVRGSVLYEDVVPAWASFCVAVLRPEGQDAIVAKARVGADGSFTLPFQLGAIGEPVRFDVELVPPWVSVHAHEPLLTGWARGVTDAAEVTLQVTRAPVARVLMRTAPEVDATRAYGGTMTLTSLDGATTVSQRTTLRGGGGILYIARPAGRGRLAIAFGAAGTWTGDIDVPSDGVVDREVVLVPPR